MSTLFVSVACHLGRSYGPCVLATQLRLNWNGTFSCREHLSGFLKTRETHIPKTLVK
ncbi:hypothetical protein CGRA01v4_02452 [Colletotrichum graminicola]|nr:hypothetical protein CGRA01v4_02452 [Colletotrichum graminicola]